MGFPLQCLLLRIPGSRAPGSAVVVLGLSCARYVGSSGSGIKPVSPALAGGFFTTEPPGKPSGQFSSVAQSCLTLCDPKDCSLSGLLIHPAGCFAVLPQPDSAQLNKLITMPSERGKRRGPRSKVSLSPCFLTFSKANK